MREERADGGQRRRAEAEAALRLVVPELFDGNASAAAARV
jgi:hypothetical protein